MAKQTGWDSIDFDSEDAPDPTFLLAYGAINGTGCNMHLFRLTVIAAQQAMRKEYGAAQEKARAQPGAAAAFTRIEQIEDKRGKVAQPGGSALTILELYKGALTALPELWCFGEKVAEASGEQDVELSWGIKKPVRIWFKLATKYDGDVSKVTDCARISVVLRSVEAFERALRFVLPLAATFKNRIKEPTPELRTRATLRPRCRRRLRLPLRVSGLTSLAACFVSRTIWSGISSEPRWRCGVGATEADGRRWRRKHGLHAWRDAGRL